MVVIGPATMATPLVQLTKEERVVTAIVQRVEDRHAVDGESDRAPEDGVYSLRPLTLLVPRAPTAVEASARAVMLAGMPYTTQYQWTSPGPGTWCMTTA